MSNQKFVPQHVREDSSETIATERRFANHMDEIFNNFQKEGGLDGNPYKGKPIIIDDAHHAEGYALNSILKNANYLPPWLEFQHTIRDEIGRVLAAVNSQAKINLEAEIDALNDSIRKYNRMVPSPLLQKYLITEDNLAKRYEQWQ